MDVPLPTVDIQPGALKTHVPRVDRSLSHQNFHQGTGQTHANGFQQSLGHQQREFQRGYSKFYPNPNFSLFSHHNNNNIVMYGQNPKIQDSNVQNPKIQNPKVYESGRQTRNFIESHGSSSVGKPHVRTTFVSRGFAP